MSSQQEKSAAPAIRPIFQAKDRCYYVQLHPSIVDFLGLDEGQLVEERIGKDGILLKLVTIPDYEERGEEEGESKRR